jgi:transcriptional regulator with XRE-family HTH domain
VTDARSGGAPTVLRVVLGKRLQDLREKAGFSYQQAGQALDVTHATIRRMEKAEAGLKIPYVEKLLRTYGVTDHAEIDIFVSLAREANQPGWWHRYRDVLPDWFSAFVSLEGAAGVIRAYEPHYVPGLLQTADYAHAVLRAGLPTASEEEIARGVALRMERQSLLTRRDAPLFWVVLDETVLRRPIGGPGVMRAQTARLIEACALPNVRLQIRPPANHGVLRRTALRDVRTVPHLPLPDPGTAGCRLHGKPGRRRLLRRTRRCIGLSGGSGPDVRPSGAGAEHRGHS